MDSDRLLKRVCERCGLSGDTEAEGALVAVLESLSPGLDPTTRERMADALPPPWSLVVRDAKPFPDLGVDDLAFAVAEHERVGVGFGIEHATAVCQVLAEAVDEELRSQLRSLPNGLGSLFDEHVATEGGPERLPAPHARETRRRTLAEGNPGSLHPLSEGRPGTGQQHSVAASDDPHRDTKLSSAQGTTQERQGHTLAEGKPGSERPISEEE